MRSATMKVFLILMVSVLCFSCSGKQKKGKTEEQSVTKVVVKSDSLLNPDIASVVTKGKYRPVRGIDPEAPPVVLNFSEPLEETALEGKKYFHTVSSVMIEHPGGKEVPGFLTDCLIRMNYKQGAISYGHSSSVYLGKDYILAGDPFVGIYAYDKKGRLCDTLITCAFPFKYDASGKELTYTRKVYNGFAGGFDLVDNCCSYVLGDTTYQYKTVWYDLDQKRMIREIHWEKGKQVWVPYGIDGKTYYSFYQTVFTDNRIFMRVFGPQGDTLCEFPDYIRLTKEVRGTHTNPDHYFCYKLNKQLYIRQAYSDTVFRLVDAHRLLPVYLLDFGEKRTDMLTGMIGDKSDKLIPAKWIELPNVVLFSYTENYDCQNTRDEGTVHFFYTCFDKKTGKLFRLPVGENVFPEEFFIDPHLKDALPFTWEQMQMQEGKLLVTYTRERLEAMIQTDAFKKLSPAQQAKLKNLHARMNDRQMYVMIIA